MNAVLFWLSVTAVAVIGAALFVAGLGVGFGIARRRYCRKRKPPAPIPPKPALRDVAVTYSVRNVEFVPVTLSARKEVAP